MRHGLAEERMPGVDDETRALTREGEKRTAEAIRGLKEVLPIVHRVVSSPLLRARQTASLLGEAYAVEVDIEEVLAPGGKASMLLTWGPSERVVAMVGHEPDLSELAGFLLTGEAQSVLELKKAGCVLLSVEGVERARLIWSLPPKVLRRMGE